MKQHGCGMKSEADKDNPGRNDEGILAWRERNGMKKKNGVLYAVSAIVLLCVCEWFFFRKMYGSVLLFGDTGDGRLTMLITEHWYHVFRGQSSVTDLGIFYPAPNTLGYSDLLLGFGLIHSVFRLFGLDMYLAYKYTILFVHAVGTFSCWYLLKRVLGVKPVWAFFGTLAFSFSDSYITSLNHAQLAAISLIPLFAIFVIRFFQFLPERKKRNLYAIAAIVLIELVLYTAWYIAFFSALFAGICLVVWLLLGIGRKGYLKQQFALFFRTVRYDLLIYAAIGVALAVPFILLELPISKMSGGRDYYEFANDMIATLPGVIHVSADNWLLGQWFESFDSLKGANHEIIRGFSVVLLGLFAAGLVRTVIRMRRKEEPESDDSRKNRTVWFLYGVIAVSVLINVLLSIRWNDQGLSGWHLVYKLVPGGKSIRAVGRIFLFLNLPMAVITACIWSRETGKETKNPWLRYGCAVLAVVLLFVTNLNTTGVYARWDRDSAVKRLERISPPPEDCETFYYVDVNKPEDFLPFVQTDAYELADAYQIKTINGYSGLVPANWGEIWLIDGKGYFIAVDNWIKKYDLQHVYAYAVEDDTWIQHVAE